MADKIVYDIIDENSIESRGNVVNKFNGIYDEAIINECYDEIEEFIENEQLKRIEYAIALQYYRNKKAEEV